MLTIGSLFAGIGGLELGLEQAGLGPVVFQCEIDPFCLAVLEKHWPTATRYTDVRAIDATAPQVDLLCGGFPCQDISNAGKRAGIDGERSGLWGEFARVIRLLRPRVVAIENVSALLVRGMDRVLGDLATLGYDAEWSTLRASDVGAPHRRERIFIIAWRRGGGALADSDYAEHDEPEGTDRASDLGSESRRPELRARGRGQALADPHELRPRRGEQRPWPDEARHPSPRSLPGQPEVLADGDGGGQQELGVEEPSRLEGASGGELDGRGDDGGFDLAEISCECGCTFVGHIDDLCPECGRVRSASVTYLGPEALADAPSPRRGVPRRLRHGQQWRRSVAPDGSAPLCDCGHRPDEHDFGDGDCLVCSCTYFVADPRGGGRLEGQRDAHAGEPDAPRGGASHVDDAQRDAVRLESERDQREGGRVRAPERGDAEPRDDREGGRREIVAGVGRDPHGISHRLDRTRWPSGPGEAQQAWEPPRTVTGRAPNRNARLRSLGNAVVPACAEVAGRRILALMAEGKC